MINHDEYRDKVYGCWLGKNVGGTIGAPFEGDMNFLDLPEVYPETCIENDDLELQLVWLQVLRDRGIRITAKDLAEGWQRHLLYHWDEYGVALANLRMGLQPPVSGYYNNWFKDSMGSPIRSELWACLFPNQPECAAYYALQDAQVDHWGEGVYGEIFFAVLESLAFSGGNIVDLVTRALPFIDSSSRVAQAARLTLDSYHSGAGLRETRELILERFGHHNFTDCVQNVAFTVLGLLHGKNDFLRSIIYAANCGYDVDCTAATAGSIIGILLGGEAIVSNAGDRLDQKIVIGWGVRDCQVPATVGELTDEVVAMGEQASREVDLPTLEKNFQLGEIPDFTPPLRVPFRIVAAADFAAASPTATAGAQAEEVTFDTAFPDLNPMFVQCHTETLLISTNLKTEVARTLLLLAISNGPVRCWLDGELIIDEVNPAPFIPATQRPSIPVKPVSLSAGWHRVEILLQKPAQGELEFAWIVADDKEHWVTDLEYAVESKDSQAVETQGD